jgi:hypothetical protein
VIKALGLGNLQWAPLRAEAPDWMLLGFDLFRAAYAAGATTHEIFPSASYNALARPQAQEHAQEQKQEQEQEQERAWRRETRIASLPLHGFRPGPKDMLDAVVGAFTVLRFVGGEGCEVGGDGLGTLILPVPVDEHPVMTWASGSDESDRSRDPPSVPDVLQLRPERIVARRVGAVLLLEAIFTHDEGRLLAGDPREE